MRRYREAPSEAGLVLRLTPFREKDFMVSILFATQGRRGVLWKSARTKKGGGFSLDIGDFATFELAESTSGPLVITGIGSVHSPKNLRTRLEKITLLSVLIEITERTVQENMPDTAVLYKTLRLGIDAIDEAHSLSEELRALTLCLVGFGEALGMLDSTSLETPGIRLLKILLRKFEEFTGKELNTRSAIEPIIAEFVLKGREP